MEVGDLSSREIEPDRAIADLFSHRRGRKQSRKGGTQTAISQAQRLTGEERRADDIHVTDFGREEVAVGLVERRFGIG